MCTDVGVMSAGRLVWQGALAELRAAAGAARAGRDRPGRPRPQRVLRRARPARRAAPAPARCARCSATPVPERIVAALVAARRRRARLRRRPGQPRGAVRRPHRGGLRCLRLGSCARSCACVLGRRRNQVLLVILGAGAGADRGGGEGQRASGPRRLDLRRHHRQRPVRRAGRAASSSARCSCRWSSSVVAGDAIAGEANTGTLRYLLAGAGRAHPAAGGEAGGHRRVDRRLRARRRGDRACWPGSSLFPAGRLTLLSGHTVSYADGLGRLALVAAVRGGHCA